MQTSEDPTRSVGRPGPTQGSTMDGSARKAMSTCLLFGDRVSRLSVGHLEASHVTWQ